MLSGEFVSFSIGEDQDYAEDNTVDVSDVEIGMGFNWQSSRPDMGTGFRVIEGTAHCQCVFNFCSTTCLRRFMNSMVDQLEELIQKEKPPESIKTETPIPQQSNLDIGTNAPNSDL